MYKQIKSFNQSHGGNKKNDCLKNTRLGYDIKAMQPTAWEAWRHTQQHTSAVPANLDVPVFFSYTATIGGVRQNWGHVGVRLKNGKVWSDGNIYANIAAYEKTHAPRYVGWGESLNGIRILGWVPDSISIVVKKGTWNIRKTPSGASIGVAKGGTKYSATIGKDGWARIASGKYIGPAAYKKV